jgi:hypothetical protein
MKRQNNNLIQNYTDDDLQSFAILENFDNYKIDSIETKNIQLVYQSVDYSLSDNQQFKKLMNFNKNIKTSSKEYSIDDFSDNDELTDKRTHKDDVSFYNESDMQNFKNLKQFPLSISSDSFKYTNKKEDPVVTKINYTVSDLEAFDRIVESNEGNTNNQTAANNADAKNLMSNIDRSSIKIIDFDKLKKRETINNKQRIEKIKVVYFD